jgi:hypothetical protein
MSASSLTPPTRRPQAPAPRGPSSRRGVTRSLVGFLLIGVTGCAGGSMSGPTTPSPVPASATPAGTPPPVGDEASILLQYEKFWADLATTSKLPADQRREALAKLTVDPQLTSVLKGLQELDRKGHVLYGVNKPRPKVQIAADQKRAVVDDCQDSSAAGTAEAATGKRLTVGKPRNHVVVTMQKGLDGIWKMAFASYTKKPC